MVGWPAAASLAPVPHDRETLWEAPDFRETRMNHRLYGLAFLSVLVALSAMLGPDSAWCQRGTTNQGGRLDPVFPKQVQRDGRTWRWSELRILHFREPGAAVGRVHDRSESKSGYEETHDDTDGDAPGLDEAATASGNVESAAIPSEPKTADGAPKVDSHPTREPQPRVTTPRFAVCIAPLQLDAPAPKGVPATNFIEWLQGRVESRFRSKTKGGFRSWSTGILNTQLPGAPRRDGYIIVHEGRIGCERIFVVSLINASRMIITGAKASTQIRIGLGVELHSAHSGKTSLGTFTGEAEADATGLSPRQLEALAQEAANRALSQMDVETFLLR